MLIPLIPFERMEFPSVLHPEELVSAVQGALEGRIELPDAFGERVVRYRGSARGAGFRLWPESIGFGFLPLASARVERTTVGSRIMVTIRPQWNTVVFTLAIVAIGVVLADLEGGRRLRGTQWLALLGILYFIWYWLAWIPERSRLARLISRIGAAEF